MSRLEEVREFSKLMAKEEHFRRREKLKQRLQTRRASSVQRTPVTPMWLEPSGVDGGRRLET